MLTQYLVRYEYLTALDCGEKGHALQVMVDFLKPLGGQIVQADAHPVADCWIFLVEVPSNNVPWPAYMALVT